MTEADTARRDALSAKAFQQWMASAHWTLTEEEHERHRKTWDAALMLLLLVAADRDGREVAAEREACAKVADEAAAERLDDQRDFAEHQRWPEANHASAARQEAEAIAAAIRARQTEPSRGE